MMNIQFSNMREADIITQSTTFKGLINDDKMLIKQHLSETVSAKQKNMTHTMKTGFHSDHTVIQLDYIKRYICIYFIYRFLALLIRSNT